MSRPQMAWRPSQRYWNGGYDMFTLKIRASARARASIYPADHSYMLPACMLSSSVA